MFNVTYAALWAVVLLQTALLCVAVCYLYEIRRDGSAGAAAGGFLLGNVAPDFSALDVRSGRIFHSSTLKGRHVVLCFVSSTCRDCHRLLKEFADLDAAALTNVVFILHAKDGRQGDLPMIPTSVPLLVENSTNIITAFQISGLPTAVILDSQWRVVGLRYPSHARDVLESLLPEAEYEMPDALLQSA
jgi:hypothetical protein